MKNIVIRNLVPATVIPTEDGNVKVEIPCIKCGKTQTFCVPEENFLLFHNRALPVQDAFPMLSPAEREIFLSGFCSVCYDRIFSEED